MKQTARNISPGVRGAIYYFIFYAVIGGYFAYMNVAFINRGMSGVQIGIISSVGALLGLIGSPFLTGLADRNNWHKPMLILSNFCFGLALIGVYFAPSFVWMLPAMAIGSFLGAPLMPLSDSLLVRMSNIHQLDFGHMRVWGSIGFTLVCILAGLLWDVIGLEWLFLVSGMVFMLRAFSVLLLEARPAKLQENQMSIHEKQSWLTPFKDRQFSIFLIGIFFWGCSTCFFNYTSIYMNQLGGNNIMIGLMMALLALGEIPAVMFADRLTRRFGLLPVYVFGIFGFCVIIIAVIFVHTPMLLVILNGLRGLGFGLYIVAGVRYVDKRASEEQMGLYQSLYNVVLFTVSTLVFMPFLGYLFDYHGIQWTFVAKNQVSSVLPAAIEQ